MEQFAGLMFRSMRPASAFMDETGKIVREVKVTCWPYSSVLRNVMTSLA